MKTDSLDEYVVTIVAALLLVADKANKAEFQHSLSHASAIAQAKNLLSSTRTSLEKSPAR